MKYRVMAKCLVHDMIKDRVVIPDDGLNYSDDEKPLTPKQVTKLQEALNGERARIAKKLKSQGVKV